MKIFEIFQIQSGRWCHRRRWFVRDSLPLPRRRIHVRSRFVIFDDVQRVHLFCSPWYHYDVLLFVMTTKYQGTSTQFFITTVVAFQNFFMGFWFFWHLTFDRSLFCFSFLFFFWTTTTTRRIKPCGRTSFCHKCTKAKTQNIHPLFPYK